MSRVVPHESSRGNDAPVDNMTNKTAVGCGPADVAWGARMDLQGLLLLPLPDQWDKSHKGKGLALIALCRPAVEIEGLEVGRANR